MQFIGFKSPDYEIKTKYTVEYLCETSDNGRKRYELYLHATERGSTFEPWELVDKREFDDLADAMEFYLIRLLDENNFVVHPVFEELYVNGVLVRETTIEEKSTFVNTLRRVVCNDTEKRLAAETKTASAMTELASDYEEFVNRLPWKDAKDRFYAFRIDREKQRKESGK